MSKTGLKTKTNNTERKNAVIYARYSSSSQNEQSIDGQIRVINDYAKRNGYRMINTYIDRAMTGRNDDRPDFQRMIADSDSQEFDVVLVYKLDRFSRDRSDSAINKRALKKNGVRVISATENISEGAEGIIYESILEGYAEFYSAELSQKVRRGLKESRIKGNFTGGYVLYGYEVIDKKLVIKESEAGIIRQIYSDCAKGVLLKHIADNLNTKGIRTKQGSLFTINIVSRILNNEKYCGIVRNDDTEYRNIVPALVDEELFEHIKGNLEVNKHRTAHFKAEIPYYLSGKITCAYCGQPMNGETGTGRNGLHYYYKCMTNKKGGKCEKKTVKKVMLEDYVIEKTQRYILQPKYIRTVAKDMTDAFNACMAKDTELIEVKKLQAQNDKEIQNILTALRKGIITASTKQLLEELEEIKESLTIRLAKLSSTKRQMLELDECSDFLFSLTALDYFIPENRAMLFNRFIRRVELGNERIRIFYNPLDKPFVYNQKDDIFPSSGGSNSGSDASLEHEKSTGGTSFIAGSPALSCGGVRGI